MGNEVELQSMDWFCSHCGEHNREDSRSCITCGAPGGSLPLLASLRVKGQAGRVDKKGIDELKSMVENLVLEIDDNDLEDMLEKAGAGSTSGAMQENAKQVALSAETWERFVQPKTDRVWFWNPATEEVFYADDAKYSGWEFF